MSSSLSSSSSSLSSASSSSSALAPPGSAIANDDGLVPGEEQAVRAWLKEQGFQGRFKAEGDLRFSGDLGEKLKALKARTNCKDCGLPGHWAGDPECKKPSERTKRLKAQAEQNRSRSSGGHKKPDAQPPRGAARRCRAGAAPGTINSSMAIWNLDSP